MFTEKPIELVENHAGGVDLLTERDCGNPIRILTGKAERSYDYWARLRNQAVIAMLMIEEKNGGKAP